ncbi:MAG: hypothetical protein ACQER9_00465 [Nanobdellota archaeon]
MKSLKKVKIRKCFDHHFNEGGMSEYLTYNRKELIQQVYEDILLKV